MKVVIGKSDHFHLVFHDANLYNHESSQIIDIPESLVTEYQDIRRKLTRLQEQIRRMAMTQGMDLGVG